MNDVLRRCLNWKVLAALAGVGVIVWAVAPNMLRGAAPLLLLLACPLSMIVMMLGMRGGRETATSEPGNPTELASDDPSERIPELLERQTRLRAEQEALDREIATVEARVLGDREADSRS